MAKLWLKGAAVSRSLILDINFEEELILSR